MTFDSIWRALRDRCGAIDPDTVLVTPSSERPFRVVSTDDDRIVIRYVETDDERVLWRNQFDVLYDRMAPDSEGLSFSDLPPGVEPYVSVLSLAPQYAVDRSTGTISHSTADEREESPFLRPEWTTRTPPERVHDDAILLADLLERHDVESPRSLSSDALVDLYVLLSDVQHGTDRIRQDIRDVLLDYIGPDARLHGQFGTVHRTSREVRRLNDEETVLAAIDEHGIPREWVMGIDPSKLDVVLAVTDLDESDVYTIEEQVYVQKTEVEEGEKQSRLQGLKDRLATLEDTEAEELRADIEQLEDRIDALLAAG